MAAGCGSNTKLECEDVANKAAAVPPTSIAINSARTVVALAIVDRGARDRDSEPICERENLTLFQNGSGWIRHKQALEEHTLRLSLVSSVHARIRTAERRRQPLKYWIASL